MRLLLLPLFAVLLFGAAACSEDESAGPEEGATVEDVRENEDEGVGEDGALGDDEVLGDEFFVDIDPYVGEQVTVSAEVAEIVTANAITIAGEGGGEPVLVLSQTIPDGVSDNAVVQVRGTVREFLVADIEELEDEFGFDLDEEALAEFDQQHVIVDAQIEVLDPTEDGGEELEE